MQISEDLDEPCEETRERLDALEKDLQAMGGGFASPATENRFGAPSNVLNQIQERKVLVEAQRKVEMNHDERELAAEDIENFLPD